MQRSAYRLLIGMILLAACATQPEPIIIETPIASPTPYVTAAPTARPTRTPVPRATTASRSATINLAININLASADELDTLPRIGPALAQRIIAHRQAHGPFKRIEDIKDVSGIGDAIFEEIKGMIRVE